MSVSVSQDIPGRKVLHLGPVTVVWRPRAVLVGVVLLVLCSICAAFLLGSGTARLSPAEVLATLMGHSDSPAAERLLWRIRLPRLLVAMMTGASLGLAGAAFQALSRNPLGSPDVIGFTTGAASGAIIAIIMFAASPAQTAAAAVLSGMATALLVLALAKGNSSAPGGYHLILVGIGVGATLSGLNALLTVMGDLERAMSAHIWLSGSLEGRSFSHVWIGAIGFGLFAPPVFLCARRLAAMDLGDDMAREIGVPVGVTRAGLMLASVGLTSVATACVGPVAFVALAAPQLARGLSRTPGTPMATAALMGGLLVLVADLVGQNAPWRLSLPIGLMTGVLGGVYMILVLLLSRR